MQLQIIEFYFTYKLLIRLFRDYFNSTLTHLKKMYYTVLPGGDKDELYYLQDFEEICNLIFYKFLQNLDIVDFI